VVLVPCGITAQLDDKHKSSLLACCDRLISKLCDSGLRVRGDFRDHYSPGWKFNHWELKVSTVVITHLSSLNFHYWFASASFSGPLLSVDVEFCLFVCVFVCLQL